MVNDHTEEGPLAEAVRKQGRDPFAERKPWQPPSAPGVEGPPLRAENLIMENDFVPSKPSQLVISDSQGLTVATIGLDDEGVLHVSYDPDRATEAASQFMDSLRIMFGKVGARSVQGRAWAQGVRDGVAEFGVEGESVDAWVDRNNPYAKQARDMGDVE